MADEENQGLLQQNPQDSTQRTSYSNWNDFKVPPSKTPPQKSNYDAVVIVILVVMIGMAGFGLVKHYDIGVPEKPIDQPVIQASTGHSAVEDVYKKINDGLQKLKLETEAAQEVQPAQVNMPKHTVIDDEKDIDNIINEYLTKKPIEQFTNIQTQWVDDDEVEKQIEAKILDQQNMKGDLDDLILSNDRENEIIKPTFSTKVYSYEQLNNGIKTILIQSEEPQIKIVLTLQMGQFSDPIDQPGLTELLFRTLETEYEAQVDQIYTTLTIAVEDTQTITELLDDLHDQLSTPTFNNIQSEAQRMYDDMQIEQRIASIDFVVRSLNNLINNTNQNVLQTSNSALSRWLQQYMSSDIMTLTIQSRQTVDEMWESVMASKMQQFINKEQLKMVDIDNTIPTGQMIIKYKSQYDEINVLTFSEQYSCQRFLLYLLPKQFNAAIINQKYMIITLEPAITETLNNIASLHDFYRFLKQADENQLQMLYSQMLATEELAFNSNSKDDLHQIGANLFGDPHYALRGEESLPLYDKDEFDLFLDSMMFDYAVLVASQNFLYEKDHQNQQEDLAFIRDAVLSNQQLSMSFALKSIEQSLPTATNEFVLPPLSEFLPENVGPISVCQAPIYELSGFGSQKQTDLRETVKESQFDGSRDLKFEEIKYIAEYPMPDFTHNCELKEHEAQVSLVPYQVLSNVWWKPSRKGAMVFTGLFIEKPTSSLAVGKTMLKVLQKYYTELVRKTLSQELLFGYEVTFKENLNGLNIQLLSYSEKQNVFLDKVFEILNQNDSEVFQTVKNSLIKDIRRFHEQKLSLLSQQYYLPTIMLRPVNTPQEVLDVLESLQFEQVMEFKDQLLKSKIQILNMGNILPQESAFSDSTEVYWTKTLNLKGKQLVYAVHRENNQDTQSSVTNYYQFGLRTTQGESAIHYYVEYLTQYALTYFTMGEQIQIKRRTMGCVDGMNIYMQDIPGQANDAIEKFLNSANENLQIQLDSDITTQKQAIIKKFKDEINFKTLQEEGTYIWERIVNYNYGFNEVNEMITYLDSVSPTQLVQDILNLFQGKISVQVYAQTEEIPTNPEILLSLDQAVGLPIYECFFTL